MENTTIETWVDIPENCDFTIHNLPYGIFSYKGGSARVGVAIGEQIIDLKKTAEAGLLESVGFDASIFSASTLNPFISAGRGIWQTTRKALTALLDKNNDKLKNHAESLLVPQSEATMHLPVTIGDYTDFYSSKEHATNVGSMFRDPDNALMPNWKHLPVGYHGRASSIVVSGTDIHRPKGQTMPPNAERPVFGPSKRMDFELEMAFVVGSNTKLGESIPADRAEDHIFGMVIFNDWSARDIQKWEYVPLGPFLGKNFGSSISPWIVTMEALEPFRTSGPAQDVEVLDYLKTPGEHAFDISLEVHLQPEGKEAAKICTSNFKHLYWNMAQQLAHHTVNGCNVRVGDMMASGTISGPTEDSYGSMLELSWAGKKPMTLPDGTERSFLEDNDTVVMKAYSEKEGKRIGFGEVRSKILPAKK